VDLFVPVTNGKCALVGGNCCPFSSFTFILSGGISFVQFMTFFVCFPIMFIKQTMNLVQLIQAAQDIVALDEEERRLKAK
jgi:hypothetical protein